MSSAVGAGAGAGAGAGVRSASGSSRADGGTGQTRGVRGGVVARVLIGTAVLIVVLVAACVLSLCVGANPIGLDRVVAVLSGGGDAEARYIIAELRIPRTITGLAAGAALGVAGALTQAFTRNPLADPGILGVNAGAAFAIAVGIAVFGLSGVTSMLWLAFTGALIVTVGVYRIGSSGRGAPDPVRLTLAGVALGAVFSGITTGLTLSNPDAFDSMRGWNAGTLLGRGLDVLVPVVPFILVAVVAGLCLTPALNSIALGEDVARGHGANVAGTRIGVIAIVTVLAGAATALAGPISFLGLMAPHVVRWLFGTDQRVIVWLSALLAPSVLLLADVLGRVIIAPAELPVGIVVACVGAPILIGLVRRRRAAGL
ncbi:MAG: iron chelate uptake ABC transporter family permease subunit [Mycetocola sp.]